VWRGAVLMVEINEYQKWLDKMIEKVCEEDIVLSKELYGFNNLDSSEVVQIELTNPIKKKDKDI
jgi:hypothetical protein